MFYIIIFLIIAVIWFILREKKSVNKHFKNINYQTKNQRNNDDEK
ncbi:hypothetical protein SAMN05216520_10868 [Kandleria vitulina]|jgi:hypothetical protein|nr:hypothetical protein SAMN05216520_10868 [Kandleria vitulina]SEJ06178.1 hypothetical protein SAMN05216514_10959 [Kandleria vitulina]